MRLAPVFSVLVLLAGCDKPAETTPPPSGSVSEFHISIFNACTNDVTVKVGAREVHLFKDARETITGGSEQVILIGKGGEVLATYQPIQGNQKAQITSDCTAIERVN
jgi:hypothetical protein